MASEEFEKLKAYMAANPMPPVGREEMRKQMEAFGTRAKLPDKVLDEVVDNAPIKLRTFTPANAGPGLILFAHGGGFTLGSIGSHCHVAAWLGEAAKTKIAIFDYRLAPEHPFPAALEDYRAVFQWAIDQGYWPDQIALAGDSAGANLSVSLAVGGSIPKPAAIAALSPSFDVAAYLALGPDDNPDVTVDAGSIAEGFEQYCGALSARDPRISPNYADLTDLPPTLVQFAQDEVFAAGARDFAEKALAAGAEVEIDVWPEMLHDWHWYAPRLPEAREALRKAGGFLARHLA